MMSAVALLGALAKITVVGFRKSRRMDPMFVTVLPVPGLNISMSETSGCECKECTHGPKTMKGGEPGGSLRIEDTARFWAGFVSMSGLKVTITPCNTV